MRHFLKFITLITFLSVFQISKADEGMWLINLLDKNLTKKMQKEGLKIDPKLIFDENIASISNAVVALDFGCTGSIISNDGLLITNHHCAYSDIHALSTPSKNYLEDGFWAMTRKDEIPIKGKSVFFLRKAFDATEEISSIIDSLVAKKLPSGMRKVYSIIEDKHKKMSGMEAMCMSMWRGSKYYMFYYDVYTDIRLVGAPPVSVAAYGGETDNWEWPQHKGDFALYRVYGTKDGKPALYSQDNVPIAPKKVLTISTKGVKEGDFTMVLGFPGRTNRYNNSFAIYEKEKITNPVSVKLRREKLNIMKNWMDADPNVRLKYADLYFGISNGWEFMQGETYNFRRYGVVDIKSQQEKELKEWINQNPDRTKKWGELLNKLSAKYKATEIIAKAIQYYRETMVSGSGFIYMGNRVMQLKTAQSREKMDTLKVGSPLYKEFVKSIEEGFAESDMRVEKDLLQYQIKEFLANVPTQFWGDFITKMNIQFKGDSKAIADHIYSNTLLMHPEKFKEAVKSSQPMSLYTEDPIFLLAKSTSMIMYNEAISKIVGKEDIFSLETQYSRAIYQMKLDKNVVQYPDANSTMRLTYGTVGPINPSDGIYYSSQSTTKGIWDKFNPDEYDFHAKPEFLELLKTKDWGKYGENGKMYVDFLSNNDITGGNSGSPVLNGKGELIGLAFDGNKESLASDAYFHPDFNKTVSVDIRYVLWIIEKYAKADHLIQEMNFAK